MNKSKISVLFICFIICMLCGCAQSKDDVKLLSKAELAERAKNYCDADLIDYVEDDEQYIHTAYFRDRKTGIEFLIASYAAETGVDGNSLGYAKKYKSDFISKYADYINEQLDPKKYNCGKVYGNDSLPSLDSAHELTILNHNNPTEDEFSGFCKEIKEKDENHFFTTVTVVYDANTHPMRYLLNENKIIKQ